MFNIFKNKKVKIEDERIVKLKETFLEVETRVANKYFAKFANKELPREERKEAFFILILLTHASTACLQEMFTEDTSIVKLYDFIEDIL